MQRWIGYWVMVVAVLHTVFAVVMFGNELSSIVQRGVFNTVQGNLKTAATVWFFLFSGMLFICGLALRHLEATSSGPLPKSLGWGLLVMGLVGVVLMPTSGFWLIFPAALAILIFKQKESVAH
jgi:hypothetical protein